MYTTRKKVPSTVAPGVLLTIRALNLVQRGRRDMATVKERAEIARLVEEQREVVGVRRAEYPADEDFHAAFRAKLQALAGAEKRRIDELYDRQVNLERSVIAPAIIRAGLVCIEGLQIDGKQVLTVDEFLEAAPDELIDEAWKLCESASVLSEQDSKN